MVRIHSLAGVALIAVTLLLTACNAGAPRQIASYPAEAQPAPTPIAREPYLPGRVVVYTAYVEFEVADVDAAAERARQMAAGSGGYLADSQSWYQDGRRTTTLTLAVPVERFDELRRALADLGRLASERISSATVEGDAWPRYAHITVQLRQAAALSISLPPNGWNPIRTFERAFSVIATVIQFMADVLIWVVVVGGPFALAGVAVWLVARRARRA